MDLFKKMLGKHNHHSHKHHGHHDGRDYFFRYQDNRYPSGRNHGRHNDRHQWDEDEIESNMHPLLQQLLDNKKIIGLLLLLAAVLIVLVVGALILLFPIMLKMAELAGEDGVAGTFAQVMAIGRLRLASAR